ncbi:DNA repair exonuclease [Xylona heveae TC161]|uniref:Double-strand break repair protein n=1 Tax=Xylona heveae (strain CBS 132557 / TC161) TaxID=1328760 RepID=A0A164ZTD2_XYLHT|nr:DNA repair exonuclease [Xylona heveae TC161]KZF19486.1 DNA repair exonuclease [Xylona heveae TC161]
MPAPTGADTIRILVSTDNHVGYNERDAIRGDDSWKSFHEVMCLAKDRDVDMVLLAGDLFHDNKPSRKSMYQVMRSLRMNCYGEKPCELEMLSDASENFQGAFNHVNYEDPDINVAIPVFSIHGNHDDPSGEGHLAALDLLQISGLLNYYGRTPESDNINVKPVLLQKGRTKLALYGMSNVRDERLFRTFRDGKVKFFRPSTMKNDWFNLMSVHQNHHAYTQTGYLPENFLPEFLDLVVWGHEHECLINPRLNPETSFHVMQPGSSVATSLVPGEAVPKYVAILSVTGKDFKVEPIRLKTVRPFVMKEIVLQDDKRMQALAKKDNNRTELTRYLMGIVEGLIKQAEKEWFEAQEEAGDEERQEAPLPLVRLRVEYTAPEGGKFDCENPQRFSNRFVGKVANVNDVVQFYRKKTISARKSKDEPDLPEESVIAQLTIDNVKVEKLVHEFLMAQSLTILPQNSFGDAVSQFVDKDDKHAMEMFVNESLSNQIKHLMAMNQADEHDIMQAMDQHRSKLEELFSAGVLKKTKKAKLKPRPDNWDSDLDGDWADQPGALIHSENEMQEDEDDVPPLRSPNRPARGRGRTTASATRTSTGAKKTTAAKPAGTRGRKKPVEESEDQDQDIIMLEEDDEEEDPPLPKPTSSRGRATATRANRRAASPEKRTSRASAASSMRQTRLNFSQSTQQSPGPGRKKVQEPSDDEISDDDDDAFEPPPPTARSTTRRR